MTSTAPAPAPTRTSRNMIMAALGVAASIAATAVGTFADLSDKYAAEHDSFAAYLVVVAIIVVTAAVVFGLVVKGTNEGNADKRAAILGGVSVLSIVVFWAGLPLVIAAGSLACALIDRDSRGSFGTGSKVGLALSVLTAVVSIWAAIYG